MSVGEKYLKHSLRLHHYLFSLFLFLYFALSSADLLHLIVGIFKPKVGHVVAIALLGWALLEKKTWYIPKALFNAFLLILASMVLSALCGAAPMRSLGYVAVYLFNFCVYFLVPFQIVQWMETEKLFRIYWSSFVCIGIYAMLQLMLSLLGIYDPFALQRVGILARGQAWSYEPSYYALYMVPYVMFKNGMALLEQKSSRWKLFFQNMFMAISTSTGIIVTYPAFFGTALLFKECRKKMKKGLLYFLIALFSVAILFYETAIQTLFKFFYFGFLHFSFIARFNGIVESLKIFLRHPILGAGLGGVSTERFQEASTYDFIMSTLPEFELFDPTNVFSEMLASLGLVGLVAFIYLGLVIYRAFQKVREDRQAVALFISLAVMIMALQMNQGLFRPYVWIHIAVVYGYLFKVRTEGFGKLHHVDGLL